MDQRHQREYRCVGQSFGNQKKKLMELIRTQSFMDMLPIRMVLYINFQCGIMKRTLYWTKSLLQTITIP